MRPSFVKNIERIPFLYLNPVRGRIDPAAVPSGGIEDQKRGGGKNRLFGMWVTGKAADEMCGKRLTVHASA
jgi:hypothetical protein